jgi:hypothetical protein
MPSEPNAATGLPVAPPVHPFVIPADYVPDRAGTVSFLSSQLRQGEWLLPRLFRVVSVLGNVEIDLTRARVGPGMSRIEVRAIFGNVEITVPPGMRVECDGSGIGANFEVKTQVQPPLDADAPIISIGGFAMFANVEVNVVDPDAPGWMDRLAARFGRHTPPR